ncbi:TPA: glycosyltransferase [Haemophilus influenzae]
MKKILVVHPALVLGGAESVLIDILKILDKYSDQYNVELLLLENRQNHRIDEIPSSISISHCLTGIESEFLIYCVNHMNEDPHYFESWRRGCIDKVNQTLSKKLTEQHYDLIIDFQANQTQFANYLIEHNVNTPIIRWCHGRLHINIWRNNPDFYPHIFRQYAGIISIADEMKTLIDNYLQEINLHGKVQNMRLYNPIDEYSIHQKAEFGGGYLLGGIFDVPNEPFLLHVSELSNLKNALELVDIYAALKQKGIQEKLYLIGNGNQSPAIKARIIELGLENDCIMLGRKNNPMPFMKKAKLFLNTSLDEGLPTVFLEAMELGTPVVSYACPTGPRDILDNGKYGVLIPMGDQQTFIEKTYELLTTPALYQHYVDLLPEAMKRFHQATIEAQLIDLIEHFIKKEE